MLFTERNLFFSLYVSDGSPTCHSHPLENIREIAPILIHSLFIFSFYWWPRLMASPLDLSACNGICSSLLLLLHVVSLLVPVLPLLEISICPAVPPGKAWRRPTWGSVSQQNFIVSLQSSFHNIKTHLLISVCSWRGERQDNRTHSTYNLC